MKIGFIGAGQMARALAKGFVASGQVAPAEIFAADCYLDSRSSFLDANSGAQMSESNRDVMEKVDVLFLAVKPQSLPQVYRDLAPVPSRCLVVSIAAGVSLATLTASLGTQRLVRVMPNTPCLVGQGASGFAVGTAVNDADRKVVQDLLNTVGRSWELPEILLDAVTGLSGSGPAYVFQFIEALSDGGVRAGLPRAVATELAAQTVFGSALMVLQSSDHPAELKDRVASPGGTTIAGLHALEQGAFRGVVMNAVHAATTRSQELGQLSASRVTGNGRNG